MVNIEITFAMKINTYNALFDINIQHMTSCCIFKFIIFFINKSNMNLKSRIIFYENTCVICVEGNEVNIL